MQIRKLQLSNIKNYTEAEYDFESGVTAICGPNGAGKTTIIEAIAWAIFDHLEYKREDFLRRGSRKGSVSVSFVSKLDGRDYTVFRDTTGNYYAYDPVLQTRIAQQKQEMIRWLCTQLGVEPGTDLPTLFRTTIGVPQGTFTFDFSQVPSKRKPIFDKILKVDEYIKASDELKELLRLIERRIDEIEKQIARDEGELIRYGELAAECERVSEEISKLRVQHQDVNMEVEISKVRTARLDATKTKIEKLSSELRNIETDLSNKTEREKGLSDNLNRAMRADEIVRAARTGYEAHQDSRLQLQQLEGERAERDERRSRLSAFEQQRARLEAELDHRRRALDQASRDRAELESLTPALAEQEELEQLRLETQKKLTEKEHRDRNISKLGRELDQLRTNYTEMSRQVEEAEQHKDASERIARLEAEKRSLEDRRGRDASALTEIKHKQEQLSNVEASRENCRQECSSLDARIEKLRRESWRGTPIAELETAYRKMTDETAQIRAIIERDDRMMSEIRDGLCPLLSERCLNIKEGQTLSGYFNFQLYEHRSRLAECETVQTGLGVQLQQARAALSAQASLDALIGRLEKLGDDNSAYEERFKHLQSELNALGDASKISESVQEVRSRLASLDVELAEAREANIKYVQLTPLRARLLELKDEGLQKRKLYDAEIAFLGVLETAAKEQAEIESRLVSLGNPRATAESLRRQIAREPQLREDLAKFESSIEESACGRAALQKELEKWAALDSDIARISDLVSHSRSDHDLFIANSNAAESLPQLRSEADALSGEIASAKRMLDDKRAEYVKAAEGYSMEEHSRVRVELEDAIRRAAQIGADLKHSEQSEAQLRAQIELLEAVKRRQVEKIARRDRLKELQELAVFIRECLKKAGPYITEAYLHTISLEANQFYRDISGNSLVSLRWDSDYEIVLEEDGRDRPFNNLSGGEQMAAAISVRLALLKEFSDLRFAFFDEPTTNMDDERRRNLAQQIGRIKDFEQLFIITHDDSFEGFTDRIIPVEKAKAHS